MADERKWASTTTGPTAMEQEFYNGYPDGFDNWPTQRQNIWLLKQNKILLDKLLKSTQPPTTPLRTRIVLNNDDWRPITSLIEHGQIRAWKIRNMTHRFPSQHQQLIEWAYLDDPEPLEIDDLGPGGVEAQDTWPEGIWVRRTATPAARQWSPIVLIEFWYLEDLRKPEYQALEEDLTTTKVDRWREESIKVQGFDENDLYPERY